jgi:pimeloyl-ACP methyl ester carboxylesterase
MQEMHEKIGNSEMITIPGGGHMAPIEKPEIVTQSMEEFLSKSI